MSTPTIHEKVDVVFKDYPRIVLWRGREYKITKLGFHHKYKKGSTLFHIFSVVSDTLFFRLKLDSTNLSWILEGVNDAV
ncbi:hypothetical protein ISR94_03605 [Candidatus Microgenomates bacterium]|nr:hypothetical protein [Candidatus Microgenomates bacterium]